MPKNKKTYNLKNGKILKLYHGEQLEEVVEKLQNISNETNMVPVTDGALREFYKDESYIGQANYKNGELSAVWEIE